ncbi:MAG: OsmC family protein, partial [Acidobacteriota bacterium]
DFADTDFSSNLDDLRAAVAYMRGEHRAPQLMIGHSLGGAAVVSMASEVTECRAVVTLGAPSTTEHLRESLLSAAPELEDDSEEAEVRLAGRRFRIQRRMIDDLAEHRVLQAAAKLGKALLILHSPIDATVGISHAAELYGAAKHPKSFVSLDGADHLLLNQARDAAYAADVIATWAGRYIEPETSDGAEKVEKAVSLSLPHGEVRVRGGGTFEQEVWFGGGGHHMVADEPEEVGGGDRGPTPYDLLLAALGTCTNMTLRMYADRKGWALETVDSQLRHSKVHAKDCEECETEGGKVDIIERELEITGDLDDRQRERLFEIADRCPVHRTLTSETVIRSRRR